MLMEKLAFISKSKYYIFKGEIKYGKNNDY